jgi:hypothetical protein
MPFLCAHREDDKADVDIEPPRTMLWGQRPAFFASPDGNMGKLFADQGDLGGKTLGRATNRTLVQCPHRPSVVE